VCRAPRSDNPVATLLRMSPAVRTWFVPDRNPVGLDTTPVLGNHPEPIPGSERLSQWCRVRLSTERIGEFRWSETISVPWCSERVFEEGTTTRCLSHPRCGALTEWRRWDRHGTLVVLTLRFTPPDTSLGDPPRNLKANRRDPRSVVSDHLVVDSSVLHSQSRMCVNPRSTGHPMDCMRYARIGRSTM